MRGDLWAENEMEKSSNLKNGSLIGAAFLVAGTMMGGGMIALPVTTATTGLIPSLTLMALCWLFMTLTALILLEVTLWMEPDVHVITMTGRLLGRPGKYTAWFLYGFVAYLSLIAYVAGGGELGAAALEFLIGHEVSRELGCLVFGLALCGVLALGNRVVGRVNSILFTSMVLSYFLLVGGDTPEVTEANLLRRDWGPALASIPLLLTMFSFQTMVPSLVPYLGRNKRALQGAIVLGTFIALLVYASWQVMTLGAIPLYGDHGFLQVFEAGNSGVMLFQNVFGTGWFVTVANYFAFFGISTSFLGIALGLFDFLSDGLQIPKRGTGKTILMLLVAVPSIGVGMLDPSLFELALEVTGGYGDSILNCMIPSLMLWVGRYKRGYTSHYALPIGKAGIVFVVLTSAAIAVLQTVSLFGFVK